MIVGDNSREFVALLFATAGLDAWPVPVNPRLTPREIGEIRNHCGARLAIYTSDSLSAREHAKRDGAVGEELRLLRPISISPMNDRVRPEGVESDRSSRVAALIYTSGTTGTPKGVMLTHKNLIFVAAESARIRKLTADDQVYGVLPMSHAVGLSVILLGTLLSGATLHLASRFDPVAAIEALQRYRISILLGAPSMFSLLVEYAKLKGMHSLEFPALRIISSCSAPLQAGIKADVEKLFRMVLHNGYGITECSPNIAQTRPEAPRSDISVGTALPGVELELIGADGKPVPEGEVGELRVRGPNVMKGYYRAPEETAAAIDKQGWYNTRDLARFADRNLFIVGRAKELIIRFGFNVYPVEVEGVLNGVPGVLRSAVVGRTADANGSEDVIAFVQLVPGSSVTEQQLAKHAQRLLAPYKCPAQYFLVSEMPLTATGKVVKDELKKMIAAPA